jgi:hypothetical protein
MYEMFTDCSMHLGDLFVVGSAELSNKMVSCTVVQKMFVIKVFYSSSSVNLISQEKCALLENHVIFKTFPVFLSSITV